MPGLKAPRSEEIIVESDEESTSADVDPKPSYKAPAGFEAATITQTSSRDRQHSLHRLASNGKQIWYITAPASISVSLIKEVSTRQVAEGSSILSYKDAEYGLITEPDTKHGENMLLVPSFENKDYRISEAPLERTLHLQQLIKRPASPHRDNAPAHATPKTHVKTVRQQPEGLRMRYQPFGDRSSSEDTDEAPRFKLPPIMISGNLPRAEKHSDRMSPPKAATKDKKSPQKAKPASSAFEVPTSFQISTSSHPVGRTQAALQSDNRLSSSPKPVETAEEKAKRRAEKKRRRDMADGGPNETFDQREEESQSMKDEGKQRVANGIDQKSPEVATPKTKRKKRKFEATDNA
ncbi:MAG: hypothetical protein Q9169_001598 [Polycauliona sp. 2 TL-2023]